MPRICTGPWLRREWSSLERQLVSGDSDTDVWVGELDGKVLVFDRSLQLPNWPHVFLWSATTKSMDKYVAVIARKHVKAHPEPALVKEQVDAYQAWRKAKGQEWLKAQNREYEALRAREEKQRQADEEAKRKVQELRVELKERHKKRLAAQGLESKGTRLGGTSPRSSRTTACYVCKEELDGSIDLECMGCNWILCQCGACGCGYTGRSRRYGDRSD